MKSGRRTGAKELMVTLAVGCMVLVLLGPQWRDEVRAQVSVGKECSGLCEIRNPTSLQEWYSCVSEDKTSEICDTFENLNIRLKNGTPCMTGTAVNFGLSERCAPR
jgi:hypothetical protein